MPQLSDEVVERVARALYEHSNSPASGFKAWTSSRDDRKELFRERARVAIAAYEAKGDIPLDEG